MPVLLIDSEELLLRMVKEQQRESKSKSKDEDEENEDNV